MGIAEKPSCKEQAWSLSLKSCVLWYYSDINRLFFFFLSLISLKSENTYLHTFSLWSVIRCISFVSTNCLGLAASTENENLFGLASKPDRNKMMASFKGFIFWHFVDSDSRDTDRKCREWDFPPRKRTTASVQQTCQWHLAVQVTMTFNGCRSCDKSKEGSQVTY